MSFDKYKDVIEEGDTVILYLSATSMHALRVTPKIVNKKNEEVDNVFQTTYGALRIASLVGKRFGTKVDLSKGWAYVLHPTPELWTVTLPHRTQIIYTPDISAILLHLDIKPGSVVIEAGTGSGSLTHALARCVGASGSVFTFDFHEQRVTTAQEEFQSHQISKIVCVERRDVCSEGFGEKLDGSADAVFLDLPHPWQAVPFVVNSLRSSGGRFCSFSPCIEQVQKTCDALRSNGFMELNTMECLQREIIVCNRNVPTLNLNKDENGGSADKKDNVVSFTSTSYSPTMPGHTGYLTFATLPPTWARSILTSNTDVDS